MKIWRNDKKVVSTSQYVYCHDCALCGNELDYCFECLALLHRIHNPANVVFTDTNMKLMFNETGGRRFNISMWDCKECVFCHSEWCNSLRLSHPFHRWCGNEIYRETSLDIFNL